MQGPSFSSSSDFLLRPTGPFNAATVSGLSVACLQKKKLKYLWFKSCTYLLELCALPIMKVAACASYIPVKAIFQLKFNLQKKLQVQTNQNFVWCPQCIILCESLGKWYRPFYWNIICSLDTSCHMTKYLFSSGSTLKLVDSLKNQLRICKSTNELIKKSIMQWTFSKVHINVKVIKCQWQEFLVPSWR